MVNKIIICVPTSNRSNMVKEVLEYEAILYKEYQIDIKYYVSSDDVDTLRTIDVIKNKYGLSIDHQIIDKSLCLDYKIIEMLKDFETLDYDYYWMINDSISISEEMLKYVYELIKGKYDLIRLPLSGEGNKEDYVTENVDDWFNNCSQGMAHMASTIMNKTLLRAEHDWDKLKRKYVFNNKLDDKHGYFFMVAFYLEQITKLDSFKGIFIGNKMKWRRDSPLKRNQIYWQDKVFETWAKSYPETILKLPDIYTNKENVIRKSDNISPGRFSKYSLIHYRLAGLYNLRTYIKYKKYFKYVTKETSFSCFITAILPIKYIEKKYAYLESIEDKWEDKLDDIEKNIADNNIVIYGAGLYGEKVIKKLIADGFETQIIGVAVTNTNDNVSELCGYSVKGIDEYINQANAHVIVCALPATAESMKNELIKRNVSNYTTLFGI